MKNNFKSEIMKRIKSKFSFMKGSKYSFGYILILFLMVLTPMYAQTSRNISGQVVDELGEAIIGANVTVVGNKSLGTITDIDGNFTLTVTEGAILEVSYIGYRYKPIKIPSGVELRGSWDVQHHTQNGGTAIFTNYDGGDAGENAPSLIQLETNAGIRGITLAQLNIISGEYSAESPRKTPFLIQGQGPKVYVINVTIAIGDKGIDLASYDTSGHYVDYLGGVPLRAGIWVGGGAEGGFIRNMQFNPHYGSRLPEGGQGYPRVAMMRFVQSNCSALKFADVKNQTIFNNFVYGSVYGIHFLKDEITGKYPGKMTMIGHGSDGCTYSLFVEDADKDTKIIAVNSELVNTKIPNEPVRSYVLMGKEMNTSKVHPDAKLILYNSAFWGSPVFGAIINSGIVSFQQANFSRSGTYGVDVRGGRAHVYTSYFAQEIPDTVTLNGYARLGMYGNLIELTNNYYISGFRFDKEGKGILCGSDKR